MKKLCIAWFIAMICFVGVSVAASAASACPPKCSRVVAIKFKEGDMVRELKVRIPCRPFWTRVPSIPGFMG